jgi:formylmethanofuran dehydrogenase subunit E
MFTVNFDINVDEFIDDLFDEEEDEMMVPMDGCRAGDHVVCKLRDGNIAARHERSEDRVTLTVAGRIILDENTWEYVAYIPEYEAQMVKSAFKIRPELAKRYGMHPKYVGEFGVTLRKNNIIRVSHRPDGLTCSNCDEFYDKAEANQEDGSLVCWSCRQNPYR